MAGVRQGRRKTKINIKRYMLIYLRGRDKQKKRNGGWWKRLIRSRRNRDKCFVFRLSYSFPLPPHIHTNTGHTLTTLKRTTSINGHYLKRIFPSSLAGRERERNWERKEREAARVWTLFWSLWEYVREGGMQLEWEGRGILNTTWSY